MASSEEKAAALALRKLAAAFNDPTPGLIVTKIQKHADALDPPQSRVDRIMGRLDAELIGGPTAIATIRRILEQEGI